MQAALKLEAISRSQGANLDEDWIKKLKGAALESGLPAEEVVATIRDMREAIRDGKSAFRPFWSASPSRADVPTAVADFRT